MCPISKWGTLKESRQATKKVSQQMLAQSEKTRSTIDLAAQSMAQNQAGVRRGENLNGPFIN